MTRLLCLALLMIPGSLRIEKIPGAALEYYEHGEFQRAVEIFSQRARGATADAELRFWLGKCYFRLRKWQDAIRELEKAVQIEPLNSQYHLWLGRSYGKKAENTSFILALGPARRVLKEFETAVRLVPDNMDARFDLLEFYLDAPGIVGGGRDKAQDQIKQIARLDLRLGHVARARMYEKDKKWALALKELTESTVEFPKDAAGYVDLADFLFGRSDYARAADSARKALALGKSSKAQMLLAASEVNLGQNLEEAEDSLRTLIAGPLLDNDPPFEEVHYWLGEVLLAQGKKSEAAQSFQVALTFNAEFAPARSALAQAR